MTEPRTAAGRALLDLLHPVHAMGYDSLRRGILAIEDEVDAVWAHVIRDPHSHEPALLSDEELAAVNEALHDLTTGYFLDRAWIRPGPLLSETRDREVG